MPKKPLQKTARNKADFLFSAIVRSIGRCERCDRRPPEVQLQCAHWLSRRFVNIRTDFDNAASLCAGCHRALTDDPSSHHLFYIGLRGEATYARLREAANEPGKVWWPDEVERLKTIMRETV